MEIGMNKRLIALAVAAAVSAPAVVLADDSTVTLYGTLNVDFENVKADGGSGTAIPSRNRVSSNSSNIGFKGVEALGGGVDAWFQAESAVNADAGGGTWASRNTAVGLRGGFGTVLLGQWDTPYKISTLRIDPFGDATIGAYTGILGGNSQATAGNAATRFSFDRRQQNTVQYWSPNLGGFVARVGYGANEEKNSSVNPSSASVLLGYDNGPIYAGYAYEEHKDYGSATVTSKDKAHKIFGMFTFANAFTIGLVGERLKWDGSATVATYKGTITAGSDGLEVTDWYAMFGWKGGPNNVALTYGWDQKVKINGSEDSNAKAHQIGVRYGYDLSKRTQFYALYTQIDNKSSSSNNFAQNPLTGLTADQDPKGVGVGFKHVF